MKKRQKKPTLPSTVTELNTEDGSKVYVVGTAHFSDSSKKDVVKVNTKQKSFSSMFVTLVNLVLSRMKSSLGLGSVL